MATVVNADALKVEQPFYRNVVNGDRVLIFGESQQAIIYSPSRDMIVNMGPVVVDEAARNDTQQ